MVMWNTDPNFEEARKHPGWKIFCRECGKLNFYFDQPEKQGRQYRAVAFRLRDRFAPPYDMYPLETGVGKTVLASIVDAYRKAVAIGHMPDTHLELLFESQAAVLLPAVEMEDMIGDVVLVDEEEDLIG